MRLEQRVEKSRHVARREDIRRRRPAELVHHDAAVARHAGSLRQLRPRNRSHRDDVRPGRRLSAELEIDAMGAMDAREVLA